MTARSHLFPVIYLCNVLNERVFFFFYLIQNKIVYLKQFPKPGYSCTGKFIQVRLKIYKLEFFWKQLKDFFKEIN